MRCWLFNSVSLGFILCAGEISPTLYLFDIEFCLFAGCSLFRIILCVDSFVFGEQILSMFSNSNSFWVVAFGDWAFTDGILEPLTTISYCYSLLSVLLKLTRSLVPLSSPKLILSLVTPSIDIIELTLNWRSELLIGEIFWLKLI